MLGRLDMSEARGSFETPLTRKREMAICPSRLTQEDTILFLSLSAVSSLETRAALYLDKPRDVSLRLEYGALNQEAALSPLSRTMRDGRRPIFHAILADKTEGN